MERVTVGLTPAEVRCIREGLGVTAEWLADHLGVRTRTVQRWESGANPIPEFAVDALALLEADAAEQVRHHIDAFTGARPGVPLVLAVDDASSAEDWPVGWLRMVAFRTRQQIPGLRII